MSRMKKVAGVVSGIGLAAVLAGVLTVAAGVGFVSGASDRALGQRFELHSVDFPVPFPLEEGELAELRAERAPAAAEGADPLAGLDLEALATERAVERGRHLVEARYGCGECHGADFGGGVMVDDPLLGRLLAPNLTTGQGSRTLAYTPADWDRMVRHGVKPDGTPSPMPSKDFVAMSDRELSDIVTYIRSLPPVDATVEPVSFGPLGRVLLATGQFELSATAHPDHAAEHARVPPAEAPDATFGRHIAQACTGCHRRDFTGGPIVGGDPSWPAAADLTALDGWTYEDFTTAMREGKRPDGTALKSPMSEVPKFAAKMSETELRAMWAYLQSLPGGPNGA